MTKLRIKVGDDHVTGVTYPAKGKRLGVTYVLAHGAGANQNHPWMVDYAGALAERGLDVMTFNFIYTEQGKKAPDRNDKLEATWRAVIDHVRDGLGKNKLIIGGKSMGGRISSQIAAKPDIHVDGLVFLGYPLHPPGQPEKLRSKHLPDIRAPMLFVQGAKDTFGTPDELKPILKKLKRAELCVVESGDHSFKAPKSSGRTADQIRDFVCDAIVTWVKKGV